MPDYITKALGFLLPPSDHPAVTRWRLAIVASLFAVAFHVAWACGYLSSFGLSGFAMAEDLRVERTAVQQVADGQRAILVRLIANDIETARQQQCRALRASNQEAAEGWASSLHTALSEYLTLAGHDYHLRDCSEY